MLTQALSALCHSCSHPHTPTLSRSLPLSLSHTHTLTLTAHSYPPSEVASPVVVAARKYVPVVVKSFLCSLFESYAVTVLLRVSLLPHIYSGGILATTEQIYNEEGLAGFYKGWLAMFVNDAAFRLLASDE